MAIAVSTDSCLLDLGLCREGHLEELGHQQGSQMKSKSRTGAGRELCERRSRKEGDGTEDTATDEVVARTQRTQAGCLWFSRGGDTGLSPKDPVKLVKGQENKKVDFLKSLAHGSMSQLKARARWRPSPVPVRGQRQAQRRWEDLARDLRGCIMCGQFSVRV